MEPVWLVWARELQAIAQTGLTFATSAFDRERYAAIRSLAARMMGTHSDANLVRVEGLFGDQAGYATPKVDVRGAVIEDGRILLVREVAAGTEQHQRVRARRVHDRRPDGASAVGSSAFST